MSDADVLTALRGLEPAPTPEWSPGEAAPVEPLQAAFAAQGDALYRYVSALSGRDAWLAEELVVRTFVGAVEEQELDAPALFMRARHATLAVLAKADDAERPVAPAELALVLERRAGLELEELARTWGVRAASLEGRLLEATQHYTTGDEACSDWKEATVRATVDLLNEDQGEAWGEHLLQCEPCARWSEALEAQLTHDEGLPSQERTWERIQAELSKHTRDLGIRVGVRCTYCHAGLPQAEASFCAACLAPHHAECFEEHGHCAAPACGGSALVYPQRPRPRVGRRAAWPWLLGGVLVGAAALTPVAFNGGDALSDARGTSAAGAPRTHRPVPLDVLRPGVGREAAVAALGEPEKVIAHEDGETVLAYYRQGARVTLDAKGRLTQAAFFGFHTSDEYPDANGNQPLGGPVGTYLPAGWSYRGVEFGKPATSELLAGAVSPSVPDANGTHYLEVAEGVYAQLSPYMELQAIFVAADLMPDANGNVSPGYFDFSDRDASAIPLDRLEAGTPAEVVLEVLGPPDVDHAFDRGGRRLSWYELGVRVRLDDAGRLIQASFFGQGTSDGRVGAGGTRRIGGEGGLYTPGLWTYRGQRLGESVDSDFVRAAERQSTPDKHGDHYLPVEDGVIAHLEADSLKLLGVHRTQLRTYTGGSKAGTVELVPFDLTPRFDGGTLAGELLQQARAAGQLEQLVGVTRYAAEGTSFVRADLLQLEVALDPAGEGLVLTLDHWQPDGDDWTWGRYRERVGADGKLLGWASWRRVRAQRLECVRVEACPEGYRQERWEATLAGRGASARLLPEERRKKSQELTPEQVKCVAGVLFTSFVLPRLFEPSERVRVGVLQPFEVLGRSDYGVLDLAPGVTTDAEGAPLRVLGPASLEPGAGGQVVRLTEDAYVQPLGWGNKANLQRIPDAEWAERSAIVALPVDPVFHWPGREGADPWELVEVEVRPAATVARDVLAEARANGALKRVLGTAHFLTRVDPTPNFARLSVELAPDDAGLDVVFDSWSAKSGQVRWQRQEERVSWEGVVLRQRRWDASDHAPETLARSETVREADRYATRSYQYPFGELLSGQREELVPRLQRQRFATHRSLEHSAIDCSGSLFSSLVLPRLRHDPVPLRVLVGPPDGRCYALDLFGDDVTIGGQHGRRVTDWLVTEPEAQGAILRIDLLDDRVLPMLGSLVAVSAERLQRELQEWVRGPARRHAAVFVPGRWPTPMQLVEAEDPLALLGCRAVHGAPVELTGEELRAGNRLRWKVNPEDTYVVVRYVVERCAVVGPGEWEVLGEVQATEFLDADAQPGVAYRYRVVSLAELDRQHPALANTPALFRLDDADRRKVAALGRPLQRLE